MKTLQQIKDLVTGEKYGISFKHATRILLKQEFVELMDEICERYAAEIVLFTSVKETVS